MTVKRMELPIAEDIVIALNEKPSQIMEEIKIFAAMKFFETGKLSLGKSAKLAGMKKTDFVQLISKSKISAYNYPAEELADDLRNIQRARVKRKQK